MAADAGRASERSVVERSAERFLGVHIFSRATSFLGEQSRTRGRDNECSGALQFKQLEQANTPNKKELYLGLDVHKDYIATAVAEPGRRNQHARGARNPQKFRSRSRLNAVITARTVSLAGN